MTTANGISGNNIVGWYGNGVNDAGILSYVFNGTSYTTLHEPNDSDRNGQTLASGISGNLVTGDYYQFGVIHGFTYNISTNTWTTVDNPNTNSGPMGTALPSPP